MKLYHEKLFLVLLFTIIFFMNGFAFDNSDEIVERKFNVKSGGTLYVKTDRGSIEVTSGNTEEVEVRISADFNSLSKEEFLEDFKVVFDQTGNNISVEGIVDSHWSRRWNNVHIEFVITVPEEYNVELKTSGGKISVENIEGDLDLHTSGSDIRLSNIKGHIEGKTSGGNISVRDIEGEIEVKTSGGGIEIDHVIGNVTAKTSGGSIEINQASGEVRAKTSGGGIEVSEVSGSINASTSGGSVRASFVGQPKNDCSIKTSGGSVKVSLDQDVRVYVDARTSAGKIKSDFEFTDVTRLKKDRVQGEINGGGSELYLRTSAGNIYISYN